MNRFLDKNNPDLHIGQTICGYRILRRVELKEIHSFFYELEHINTKAKHIHISNDDHENTFSVAFKTVPVDSTGVAHILEHTVLCGSKKFPVRDPFFSMLKRSLSSFMNAFTAPDWTMYPFSTQNRKDFFNLMDVYLDSVFFPKLDELSFKQEGHRMEIEKVSNDDSTETGLSKIVYKGVVYNEMKGAMSSPDQVLYRSLSNAIYPSTTYRHNSGGDPAEIPDLTHDQLIAFHRRHYHPSNAFFYTYGNLPLKDNLEFINEKILKNFDFIDPKTDVAAQPMWNKPRKATYSYPLDKNEDPSKKCQICVAWLTVDIKDSYEVMVLTLLAEILIGNSASPLRKALIDSELGTALCDGTGYVSDNRDTMFAVGLKDTKKTDDSKIEAIIFNVLKDLAAKGIEKRLIDSAIHQMEFSRKEITNHPYPYGLNLLFLFFSTWLHGGDPARIFQFDADLKRLNEELSKGPLFENRIKKYFLENSHRLLLTLVPDQLKEVKENNRVTSKLDAILSGMTPSDLEKIDNDSKALIELQKKRENLSILPTLELEDISPLIKIVKETKPFGNIPATFYKQPTSGILYFSFFAGTGMLEKHMLPLIPFFCYAFSKIGTKLKDYTEMVRLIDAYTGGINLSSFACDDNRKPKSCLPLIALNGKCLVRNIDKMFEIIEEYVGMFDFSDLKRIKSLLIEYRAKMESMIVQNGHRFAISLASRNFSQSCMLHEIWHGVHQLQTIKAITDSLTDDKLKAVSTDLSFIGKNILTSDNIKMTMIGEDNALLDASPHAEAIKKQMDNNISSESIKPANGFITPKIMPAAEVPREGWSTSSAVSFVASTFETVPIGHEDAPALSVISKVLKSTYLHREIREKGGAYGGFSLYDASSGLFSFGSYRDPHIVSTLDVYDSVFPFIKMGRFTDEDIKEAVLQVCSEIDKPDPPGPAAKKAFFRKITSLTDDLRKQFKERLLSLNRNQVLNTANQYFDENETKRAVVVISNEEKLKEANEKLKKNPLKLYRI